jgi:hypothetical protein
VLYLTIKTIALEHGSSADVWQVREGDYMPTSSCDTLNTGHTQSMGMS